MPSKRVYVALSRILPFPLYIKAAVASVRVNDNSISNNTVLCVGRNLFLKDFEQLSYRVRDFRWAWIDSYKIGAYQTALIPRDIQKQTLYAADVQHNPDRWDKCVARSEMFLAELSRKIKLSCVVTANIDYWQDYSLKVACGRLGIPVIVLSKEMPSTEYVLRMYKERYRGFDANVSAVAVFGSSLKALFDELGVAPNISSTGAPRLDRWRSLSPTPKRNLITLLSFRSGYGEGVDVEYAELLLSLCKENSVPEGHTLFIKTKNARDTSATRALLLECATSRIVVDHEPGIFDLAPQSKVVIGYNSLAVLESMLSDSHILVPAWFSQPADRMLLKPQDPLHGKAATFTGSIQHLIEVMQRITCEPDPRTGPEAGEARRRIVHSLLGFDPAVPASDRVADLIRQLVCGATLDASS